MHFLPALACFIAHAMVGKNGGTAESDTVITQDVTSRENSNDQGGTLYRQEVFRKWKFIFASESIISCEAV